MYKCKVNQENGGSLLTDSQNSLEGSESEENMMNEDGSGLGPIVTALSPVLSFKTEKRPDQIEKTGSHPLLYVWVDHV